MRPALRYGKVTRSARVPRHDNNDSSLAKMADRGPLYLFAFSRPGSSTALPDRIGSSWPQSAAVFLAETLGGRPDLLAAGEVRLRNVYTAHAPLRGLGPPYARTPRALVHSRSFLPRGRRYSVASVFSRASFPDPTWSNANNNSHSAVGSQARVLSRISTTLLKH